MISKFILYLNLLELYWQKFIFLPFLNSIHSVQSSNLSLFLIFLFFIILTHSLDYQISIDLKGKINIPNYNFSIKMSTPYIQSPSLSLINKDFKRNKEIITKLKLLSESSDPIVPQHIIDYIQKMKGNIQSIQLSLSIMHNYKNKPYQILKNLCFIHFILQVHQRTLTDSMFQYLCQEITDLSSASYLYLESIRNSRKQEPIEEQKQSKKLISLLFSKTKRINQALSQKGSYSMDEKNFKGVQSVGQYNNNENISVVSELMECKQQVFCNKILIPYCNLLLKMSATLHNISLQNQETDELMYLWSMINLYKTLGNLIKQIPNVLRYYQIDFQNMMLMLTQVLDSEIRTSYQSIADKIDKKLTQVKSQFDILLQKNGENQEILLRQMHELQQRHNLINYKQIFLQISLINESVITLYNNKYLIKGIQKVGIQCPQLLTDVSDQVQTMFHILSQIQSYEKKKTKRNKKSMDKWKQFGNSSLKLKKMNLGSLTNIKSPLLKNSQPLTAGMKPKYIQIQQKHENISPLKSQMNSIVFQDQKEQNDSIDSQKRSEVSSTFQETKPSFMINLP